MKRSLLLCAALGAAAVLGGCSSLSQPVEFRVVKDSPIPPPAPAVANPLSALKAGGVQGRGGPQLRRPVGKKKSGG